MIRKFSRRDLDKYRGMNDLYYSRFRRAFLRLWARIPVASRRECCICHRRMQRFLPYGGGPSAAPPLMTALRVIGSDLDQHECPWCGSHDRERHLVLYLQAAGLFDKVEGSNILHVAPEKYLREELNRRRPAFYFLGDLFPTSPEVSKIDVQSLTFQANKFDFVIANHVLEHVTDFCQALSELVRVTRPGGHLILQTPFSNVLTSTFEDKGIDSEAGRLQAYGQSDHSRLLGRNWCAVFEAHGLRSAVGSHQQLLPTINADRWGVNPEEPFMHFLKIE